MEALYVIFGLTLAAFIEESVGLAYKSLNWSSQHV